VTPSEEVCALVLAALMLCVCSAGAACMLYPNQGTADSCTSSCKGAPADRACRAASVSTCYNVRPPR
jgi:hypothetical protein